MEQVVNSGSRRSARHDHILGAAEACFIRNGFHRTTMQDIAREAAMSAGNIYRYFASKEDVVLGLARREQEKGSSLLGSMDGVADRRAVMMQVIARHFTMISREAAVLRMDVWTETTRNPVMAEMLRPLAETGRVWFTETLASLATSPDCDPKALLASMDLLIMGAVVQRALLPEYDPAPVMAQLEVLIDMGLFGRLPVPAASTKRSIL